MRRLILPGLLGLALASGFSTHAAIGKVNKVLPHLLDAQGRHTLSPSLFDRDAYQYELRSRPGLRGGMRFDVLWRVLPPSKGLTIKVELRGSRSPAPGPIVVAAEARARGSYSQWTRVALSAADYEALGELMAWRVTLWRGDELLSEERSFLW